MELHEIKAAIDAGHVVHWVSSLYSVVKGGGQYFIKCEKNNDCIGLTWLDGETMNGKPDQFYMERQA